MRRFVLSGLTALAVGATLTSTVQASAPRARLRGFICQRALDPPARAVSVTAVMRPLHGTRRMALRFELLAKTSATAALQSVSGGDLGKWISPADPTLGQRPGDQWIPTKQVIDLAAPAAYRFRVSFRWTGTHGRLLGTAVRTSPKCFQPELRPDLLVQSIEVHAIVGKPNLNRYIATIRNAGATATGPFEVTLAPGGASPVKTRTIQGLGPHSMIQVSFVGPVCSAGSMPTVTADPNDQVDDYNRANNSLTVVCSGHAGP